MLHFFPGFGNPFDMPHFQPGFGNSMGVNMNLNFNNFMMPEMIPPINEAWAESYERNNMNLMQGPIPPHESNKINIVFKTTSKVRTNIVGDLEQTMSDIILLYLKKEGKEKLFKRSGGVFFLYNAKMIDLFDETKVKDFFKNNSNPLIIVNEMKFVIGA